MINPVVINPVVIRDGRLCPAVNRRPAGQRLGRARAALVPR
ncbi:hypothetical protein [Microbispora triticiradicis]|nr:hypothetical protein [Microbispora fusca]